MATVKGQRASVPAIGKIVRKALVARYGSLYVRVRSGNGTSRSFVDATVAVIQPEDCYCIPYGELCGRCKERINLTHIEARKVVYGAMRAAEAEFNSYTADDGYDTKRDCFLLTVRFIHPSRIQ